jgi:nucleoid DNA-binding protein
MNKSGLTRRIARASKTTNAEAADYLDYAVLSILKRWKHGQTTSWPGLGVFSRDLIKSTSRKSAKSEAR